MKILATSTPAPGATPEELGKDLSAEIAKGRQFYRYGLNTFEFTPLVGLPAVADVERERGNELPSWWPPA